MNSNLKAQRSGPLLLVCSNSDVANACDEHSWEEVQGQQRRCLEDRGYFLHEMFKVVEEDISSKTLFGDSNECR